MIHSTPAYDGAIVVNSLVNVFRAMKIESELFQRPNRLEVTWVYVIFPL